MPLLDPLRRGFLAGGLFLMQQLLPALARVVVVEQVERVTPHLGLHGAVRARGGAAREVAVRHERERLGPAAQGVDEAVAQRVGARVPSRLEHHVAVRGRARQFLAEDGRHGRHQRHAEVELVQAQEAPGRIEDAVVVVHAQHEAAREGVPVDERDRGHGISAFHGEGLT